MMPEGLGKSLVSAVEAGGNKVVRALGSGPNDLRATNRIATIFPKPALPERRFLFHTFPEKHILPSEGDCMDGLASEPVNSAWGIPDDLGGGDFMPLTNAVASAPAGLNFD